MRNGPLHECTGSRLLRKTAIEGRPEQEFYQAAGNCALLYWTIFRCMQRVSERAASFSGVVDDSDVCF